MVGAPLPWQKRRGSALLSFLQQEPLERGVPVSPRCEQGKGWAQLSPPGQPYLQLCRAPGRPGPWRPRPEEKL